MRNKGKKMTFEEWCEQESDYNKRLHNLIKENHISLYDVKDNGTYDLEISNWIKTRVRSLQLGSFEDEKIYFYINNNFDFGMPMFMWKEWCELVKSHMNETNQDIEYLIGKYKLDIEAWKKRQITNFKNLTLEQQLALIQAGVEAKWFPAHGPVVYKYETYDSLYEAIKNTDLDLVSIFMDSRRMSAPKEYIAQKYNIQFLTKHGTVYLKRESLKKERYAKEELIKNKNEEIEKKQRKLRNEELFANSCISENSLEYNQVQEALEKSLNEGCNLYEHAIVEFTLDDIISFLKYNNQKIYYSGFENIGDSDYKISGYVYLITGRHQSGYHINKAEIIIYKNNDTLSALVLCDDYDKVDIVDDKKLKNLLKLLSDEAQMKISEHKTNSFIENLDETIEKYIKLYQKKREPNTQLAKKLYRLATHKGIIWTIDNNIDDYSRLINQQVVYVRKIAGTSSQTELYAISYIENKDLLFPTLENRICIKYNDIYWVFELDYYSCTLRIKEII